MKALAYLSIIAISSFCLNVYAAEVKPIPKAFYGKWVSHIDKQLTPKQIASACRGYMEWGTWSLTFRKDGKAIKLTYPAGGVATATITSYSKFSNLHIEGMQYTKGLSEGEPFTERESFNYALKNGKLYYTRHFDDGTTDTAVFYKCKSGK